MKKIALNILVLFLIVTSAQAQDKRVKDEKVSVQKTVEFKLKEFRNIADSITAPKVFVDGKLYDFDISLIDENQIESMNVIKGEEAIRLYDSPQGVILITTKLNSIKADHSLEADRIVFRINDKESQVFASPLIIIDGNEADKKTLKQLSPDDIKTIDIFKDEKALKLYNAPNGVIIVKTKKGEDSINNQPEETGFEIEGFGDGKIKQPLFFVDGKQVDNNTIKDLSPDDIESIKVLKDKAAKKLYNAENGVVLIKTKKGE